MLDAAVWMFTV